MDASERRKRASSEAADWFARLQAGEMERAERQQFVEWLRESYIHVTEMLRIAQIQGELKRFEHWARISSGPKTDEDNIVQLSTPSDVNPFQVVGEGRDPRSGKNEGLQRPRLMFLAVAAAAALMIAAAIVLPRMRGQIIETERGERREVVLSDGSVVEVDPQTRLRVKYADELRRVFLERGRALFRVAKNPDRPFLVQADDTTVRAIGTAFGVERQTRGVIVTVAEGKVAVSSPDFQPPSPSHGEGPHESSSSIRLQHLRREGENVDPSPRPLPSAGKGAPRPGGEDYSRLPSSPGTLFLTADHQVTVPSSGAAEPVREVDSDRALAWAAGRLIFENDELGEVIAEFNRYNRVQLTVADPALAAKSVSGVFNASDPEAFIAFLQSVAAVDIVRHGDKSITIGRATHR